MLKHYLIVAFRAFQRNKAYSILNVLGLTLGITCSLVIFLYVFDELSYDHSHPNRETIYRLNNAYHLPKNGGFEEYACSGPVVGTVLPKDFPEIRESVRVLKIDNTVVEIPTTHELTYERFFAVDSNVFNIFPLPFIDGVAENSLRDQNTVVITRKAALKYFNRTDVVGESLRLPKDSIDLKITGVLEDHPSNTHLKFDYLISMETYKAARHAYMESWWSFSYNTYLLLEPNANVAELEKKIKFISRKYIPDQEDNSGYKQEFSLIPFSNIHLYSNLRGEIEPNSKASYVYIFLVVGIFILVIACINFMNMATARSAMRAKEIGMRKVAGALRYQLIGQFLGEAFLMTSFAVIVSVAGVYFLLPLVNNLTGKDIHLMGSLFFWMSIAGITLFVALLAGSYPSLFLSAFQPGETLKGNFKNSARGNGLRRALVVFQFGISIFLIAGTLIITKHLNYIRSMDLGFSKDKVLFIPTRSAHGADKDFKVMKEELLKVSGVSKVSLSYKVPGREMGNNVVRLGWDKDSEWNDMRFLAVDYDFVDTYDLDLVEGRSFRESSPSDESEAFMLNESGVRRLGFADAKEAIGQKLAWQNRKGMVIGVLKDFHFMSANVAIEPFIVIMNTPWSVEYLSAKISSSDIPGTLAQIENVFRATLPDRIFEYTFLDEDFDRQYKSEDSFMKIFMFFALVAILIACLGLYGLAMFMTELRFKEVGIRKVLGASGKSIILLLTNDFLKLVIISFVVAAPVSYWAMEKWLTSFPYREKISPLLLLLSGVIALGIALFTVSFNAIKASTTNPARSLKMD